MTDTNNGSHWRAIACAIALMLAPCGASAQQPLVTEQPQGQQPSPIVDGTSPDVDPTVLTTALVRREVLGLRELLEAKIKGATELNQDRISSVVEKIQTRLDAMDKGITLLQTRADKVPSETDIAVSNLKQWVIAVFDSINIQLGSIKDQALQNEAKNKTNIDAALEAQSKLALQQTVGNADIAAKSEASFIKQIDGLGDKIQLNVAAIQGQISALSERLTRIEGNTTGSSDNTTFIFSVIAAGGALVAIFMSLRKPVPVPNGNGNGNGYEYEPRRRKE